MQKAGVQHIFTGKVSTVDVCLTTCRIIIGQQGVGAETEGAFRSLGSTSLHPV